MLKQSPRDRGSYGKKCKKFLLGVYGPPPPYRDPQAADAGLTQYNKISEAYIIIEVKASISCLGALVWAEVWVDTHDCFSALFSIRPLFLSIGGPPR